jgi:molybdopterin-guanine dinucleotide biosynthesis protein
MTPIRIGVLGTHSTGKTTLLKRIERELRGHGLAVARTGRLAKRAAEIGLPKMHRHTAASTEWIITQGIADEIAAAAQGAHVVLVDRASFDAIAYLRAALEFRGETVHRMEMERLRGIAATQAPKYDLLLASVLDPTVPVDTGHDYDARYRLLVDDHVHRLLAEDVIPHRPVTSDALSQAAAIEQATKLCLNGAAV